MTMDVEAHMESIWFERQRYEEAEARYQVHLAGGSQGSPSSLAEDLERTRQNISQYLARGSSAQGHSAQLTPEMATRINALEKENKQLKKSVCTMEEQIKQLEKRLSALEVSSSGSAPVAAAPAAASDDDEDDDDFELFGDDDEEDDAEAEKLKAERIAKYTERKSQKTAIIAKSNIILDVKPWDDETDLKEMEKLVRTIELDGLLWGASKTVPLAYGIQKLQISCVVVDDKVGTDILEEKITEFEDFVQSVDVAAFNKV